MDDILTTRVLGPYEGRSRAASVHAGFVLSETARINNLKKLYITVCVLRRIGFEPWLLLVLRYQIR
jgi:hypothetical protein